jgi:hypothetical protein
VAYDADAPASAPPTPRVTEAMLDERHLWAVIVEAVPYALEKCAFGSSLPSGVIKHSNLTGGRPAYCAGEIVFLTVSELIVNGCSGRYGPRTREEMYDVARAFRRSGYGVWTMGCMSSEHFGQLAWQFKRMSGSSGLKVQAAIAC